MGKQAIGPASTGKSVGEIASIIQQEGELKRFMGGLRRAAAGRAVQPFSPSLDDDPFAAAHQKPAFSVGYIWSHTAHSATLGSLTNGWIIIFHVYDDGSTRRVSGSIETKLVAMKEPKKFAERVLGQL